MTVEQTNRTHHSNAFYQEQFESIQIISVRPWIVFFACVFALLSILGWSIYGRVENTTPLHLTSHQERFLPENARHINEAHQTDIQIPPITLAFPALKHHFYQG